jgi:hypothetical protein
VAKISVQKQGRRGKRKQRCAGHGAFALRFFALQFEKFYSYYH